MDAILFGAGAKRVLGGMLLFAVSAIFAINAVGYFSGEATADQLAVAGACFGTVSIGGLTLMLVRELRVAAVDGDTPDALTGLDDV